MGGSFHSYVNVYQVVSMWYPLVNWPITTYGTKSPWLIRLNQRTFDWAMFNSSRLQFVYQRENSGYIPWISHWITINHHTSLSITINFHEKLNHSITGDAVYKNWVSVKIAARDPQFVSIFRCLVVTSQTILKNDGVKVNGFRMTSHMKWKITHGCVWKWLVPLKPMVLLIIIPFLNGYFIGNINSTFSDKPTFSKPPTRYIVIPITNHY